MLKISNLGKSFAGNKLFSSLSLTVRARDRFAILGPNGSGKTTLFEMIYGTLQADTGDIKKRKDLTIGYLRQDIETLSDKKLLDDVLETYESESGIKHRIDKIIAKLDKTTDKSVQEKLVHELGELQFKYESSGGYDAEYKAKIILCGLGFKEQEFTRALNEFSGGWLMRVELAKLLMINPNVLMLDEPTNHLDLESCVWFENYLAKYKGAVLVTSHDRAFLNRITTKIMAIENKQAIHHHGNYDSYVTSRQKEKEGLEAAAKRQEKKFIKETRFIERFRYKGSKASQVQSRIKMLSKVEQIKIPRSTKRINFSFPKSQRSGDEVISLSDIHKAYDGNIVYSGVDLTINRGDKVALIGQNGVGKSTLLKILAGVLPFEQGKRATGYNVTGAYYAQHQLELLIPENRVIDEMKLVAREDSEQQLRSILGAFLFIGDDILKKVSVLSGGEKARLALAKMLIRPANLILMDEPTNHLDIASREILTDALEDYDGALCFITHDRTLIRQVANKVVEIGNSALNVYPSGYEYYLYKKSIADGQTNDKLAISYKNNQIENTGKLKGQKHKEATLRNEYYRKMTPLKRKLEEVQAEITQLENEKEDIECLFTDVDKYSNGEKIVAATKRHVQIKKSLTILEKQWENPDAINKKAPGFVPDSGSPAPAQQEPKNG